MTHDIGSVLFDLDDTLYREWDFVREAMRQVAGFVRARTGEQVDVVTAELLELIRLHGRGRTFDRFLRDRGLPARWVPAMVYIYRRTVPEIALHPDAPTLLEQLRDENIPTGIVTDGTAVVQESKVRALGLEELVDVVVYTEVLGEGAAKPALTGFVVALELLDSDAGTSAYVANDVRKDFAGPRTLGMKGILVRRGILGSLDETDPNGYPDVVVDDLGEVHGGLGLSASRPSDDDRE